MLDVYLRYWRALMDIRGGVVDTVKLRSPFAD